MKALAVLLALATMPISADFGVPSDTDFVEFSCEDPWCELAGVEFTRDETLVYQRRDDDASVWLCADVGSYRGQCDHRHDEHGYAPDMLRSFGGCIVALGYGKDGCDDRGTAMRDVRRIELRCELPPKHNCTMSPFRTTETGDTVFGREATFTRDTPNDLFWEASWKVWNHGTDRADPRTGRVRDPRVQRVSSLRVRWESFAGSEFTCYTERNCGDWIFVD